MSLTELVAAAERGKLMVLSGAGISVAPPSYLPRWWDFNLALLEEIKQLALEVVPGAGDALARLRMDVIPVAAFSDAIVNYFAGDGYFPVLRVLESDRPNANHHALAELARRGALAAVFTTNFDTLVERAFAEAGVPLRLFVGPTDFSGVRVAPPCALFKLHGSVNQATTLIDTVSQKLRGLPPYVRTALSALDPSYPLLVVGFSGTDLQFDEDYLPLLGGGRQVVWVVHPGGSVSPHARAKLAEVGGIVVEATLSEVFAHFGVGAQAAEDNPAAAEEARTRVRGPIAEWVRGPAIGPWTCAGFCTELLEEIGELRAAAAVGEAMERTLKPLRETPLTALKAFRVLARLALSAEDSAASVRWGRRELGGWEQLAQVYDAMGIEESYDARMERLRGMAAARINLAVAHRVAGEHEPAGSLLTQALRDAVEAGARHLVALVEQNRGEMARAAGKPGDVVLEHARRAAENARAGGRAGPSIEAHLLAARVLMEQGEYHVAAEELDEARTLLSMTTQIAYGIEASRVAGELAARRGRNAEARSEFSAALDACAGHVGRRLAVLHTAVMALAHTEEERPWLVSQLGTVLDEVEDADTRGRVQEMLQGVAGGVEEPLFLQEVPLSIAVDVRYGLMQAELRDDARSRVDHLRKLLAQPAVYGLPQRMRDLAVGLRYAARAAGDREAEAEAWGNLGIALDNLGELEDAVAAYREELAMTTDPLERARTEMHLALIQSRVGPAEAAEALYRSAQPALEASSPDDAARLYMNWARHRLRYGQPGALELAERARRFAAKVADPRAVPTCDLMIAEIRRHEAERTPVRAHPAPSGGEGYDRPAAPAAALPASAPDLANRGLVELERGDAARARELIHAAMALYEAAGDELGISRCLNNLADCALVDQDLGSSIELTTRALEIRQRLGDVNGEALTRAALAWRYLLQQAPEPALYHADRALLLLQGRGAGRSAALAATVRALAHALLRDHADVRTMVAEALEMIHAIDDPSLAGARTMLEEALRELGAEGEGARDVSPADDHRAASPSAEGDGVVSAGSTAAEQFTTNLREAARLKRIHRFDDALALLDRTEGTPGLGAAERAIVSGERANVLQSSGRDDDAAAEYARAAGLLRASGEVLLAQQAIAQGAVSLRRAGRLAESERALRTLLAEPAQEPIASQARIALAKTVMMPLLDSAEPREDARLLESRQLVDETLKQKLDDELLGSALLTSASLHELTGEDAAAREALKGAHLAFLRINSPHAALVEAQLQRLSS